MTRFKLLFDCSSGDRWAKATMRAILRWQLVALAALAVIAIKAPRAWAHDACSGVPDCQAQTKSPISFKVWQSKTWSGYCTGDYPYFYNYSDSKTGKISVITENSTSPTNRRLNALMTNWSLHKAKITFTLGCSDVPNNGSGCSTMVRHDPKCAPDENVQNNCTTGPVPACIQTWEEDCSGTRWYCTDDQTAIWCCS